MIQDRPFVLACQPVAADLVTSSICRSNFHFALRAVCQCAPNWSFWGLSRAVVNHMAALCSLGWWELRNEGRSDDGRKSHDHAHTDATWTRLESILANQCITLVSYMSSAFH